MSFRPRNKSQPDGVLLLLALLIMALVLSAALVLGTIVIREVRLGTVSDKGVTAFYAGESAAEEALFRILKLGQDPTGLTGSGQLTGGGTWSRVSKRMDSKFVFDFLTAGETASVPLYNQARAKQAAGVESLSIAWTSGQTMDVAITAWDGDALGQPSVQTFVCAGSPCSKVVINTPQASKAYQVNISGRDAAITDVIVSVFSTDGGSGSPVQVQIPVTVSSTGEYQGVKQAVEITVPVPPPWG
ncbi:MAG: hypothetical protein HY461_01520 [Parcubacteria group bacterium]|nr:hypothetical protein [Parcubacteria group bacterium]